MTFTTLLIANRGEIAVRVIRAAKKLGLRTVAVYSEADENALHVALADDAVPIGPAPAAQSYLDMEKIIEAAQTAGADAIHPGYGFLSENAAFARKVEAAGLVFVGPPADAIEIMGDKGRAKRAMIEAGVPCAPGYQGADQSDATLAKEAKKIGLPAMVKAAAGGGGRGMRLVDNEKRLEAAIKAARAEAESAFGSGDLIIEKAILRPRHVEIQVLADSHGNCVHLGERDCSVQRRHQKVVEEAPSPAMTPDLREAMGKAAVEAARAVSYRSAGTVEFLLDQSGAFYFLEMNTRIQVEHPVTEMTTGVDLVEQQLRIARGEPLPFEQDDIALNGASIEVRLYAEDPANDFLPASGDIVCWNPPEGEGVRVDAGVRTGDSISSHYDPMVAKIIAHGETREAARARLVEALERTALFGVANNRDFLIDVLGREAFVKGEATTAFIAETYGERGYEAPEPDAEDFAVVAALQYRLARDAAQGQAMGVDADLLEWSSADKLQTIFEYAAKGDSVKIAVAPQRDGALEITVGETSAEVQIVEFGNGSARLSVNGRRRDVLYAAPSAAAIHAAAGSRSIRLVDLAVLPAAADDAAGAHMITAPMHGTITEIAVSEGDKVKKGDRVAVLEAMKMQHEMTAGADGAIKMIAASVGAQAAAGDVIAEIDSESA